MRPSRHLTGILLCCIALGACKRKASLQFVASGQNGEKFYIDPGTIHTNGDERTFTLVAIEAKPKISLGQAYDRTTTDDRVTCAGNTFVLGEVRGYNGDAVVFDNPGESEVAMHPGGPFEAAHRYVCGH